MPKTKRPPKPAGWNRRPGILLRSTPRVWFPGFVKVVLELDNEVKGDYAAYYAAVTVLLPCHIVRRVKTVIPGQVLTALTEDERIVWMYVLDLVTKDSDGKNLLITHLKMKPYDDKLVLAEDSDVMMFEGGDWHVRGTEEIYPGAGMPYLRRLIEPAGQGEKSNISTASQAFNPDTAPALSSSRVRRSSASQGAEQHEGSNDKRTRYSSPEGTDTESLSPSSDTDPEREQLVFRDRISMNDVFAEWPAEKEEEAEEEEVERLLMEV